MSAEKAVYHILSNDSDVSTTATGGIYSDVAEQGQTPPFVVYKLTRVTTEPTKDGPSAFDKYVLTVASIAEREDLADTLSNHVLDALDDYSGTANSVVVDRITYKDKEAFFDEELYVRELEFNIIIK